MKNFKSFSQYLKETESLIFKDVKRRFGYDMASTEQNFMFTQENAKQIFNILNARIFANKLKLIKIYIIDIKHIDNTKHAAYFRRYDENMLQDMQFTIIEEHYELPNYRMSIALAISEFCHEMIHCYNEHFDKLGLKRIIWRITHNLKTYDPHNADFKRLQNKANNMGLNVMEHTMGNNKDRLSDLAAEKARQFLLLSENDAIKKLKSLQPNDFRGLLSTIVKTDKNMFWAENGNLCIRDF